MIKLNFSENDFKFAVMEGDTKRIIDIRECLMINDRNLTDEFIKQPSMFAYYATLLAVQEDEKTIKQRDREVRRAELSIKLRTGELKVLDNDRKPMKITEGSINDYINTDDKFVAIEQEILELESICKKLKVLVSASIQRKDMLWQLGLQVREDMRMTGMDRGIKN